MAGEYDRAKKRVRRVLILIGSAILTGCIITLILGWGSEKGFLKDMLYEIITGILFAAITMIGISIGNWLILKEDVDKSHDEDTARRIWSLLKAEKYEDNIIEQLYDADAAGLVMRNSISYFNNKLATSVSNLVKRCSNVFRENYSYYVTVSKNSNEYYMSQKLSYIRHFKLDNTRNPYLKVGFSFSDNELDARLDDSTFFFREVINEKNLAKRIRELAQKGEMTKIKEILRLKIFLYHNDNKFLQEEMTMSVVGETVIFNVTIPEMFISNSINDLISYRGMITFRYRIPPITNFYCVFADAAVGTTLFQINFGEGIVKDVQNNVKFVTFLSLGSPKANNDGQKMTKITYPDDNTAMFETAYTILPRSGFVVNWDADGAHSEESTRQN